MLGKLIVEILILWVCYALYMAILVHQRGPIGGIFFYPKVMQERVTQLGLITAEELKRRRTFARFSPKKQKNAFCLGRQKTFFVYGVRKRWIRIFDRWIRTLEVMNYSVERLNSTAPLPRSDVSSELFRPSILPSRVYAHELEP